MGLCDLCGIVTGQEAKLFKPSQIKNAINSGLRPPDSVWKGSLAEQSGASKTEWEQGWIQMAKKDTTDWSLCKTCADKTDTLLAKKCFIATAAFESDLAPEIYWLKILRDRIHRKSNFGETLIKLYYIISPPLADFVAKYELTKAAVRLCIRPLVSMYKKYYTI